MIFWWFMVTTSSGWRRCFMAEHAKQVIEEELTRKTPLRKSNHGEGIVSRKRRWKSVWFLPARCSKRDTCYGNVAWWLDVTRRYCINTAKPILKLFQPSGSPIILISSDSCADTQFQGEPLQRRRQIRWGWEKIGDFRWKSSLSMFFVWLYSAICSCMLVVLVKLSVLAKWLAIERPSDDTFMRWGDYLHKAQVEKHVCVYFSFV